VGQLQAQQELARSWGADLRDPYAYLPCSQEEIITWPHALLDPRMGRQRAIVEAPYRRNPKGQANPTNEDYQNMIGAAGRMRSILGRMSGEISPQDSREAERFLDRLVAQARCHGESPILQYYEYGAGQQQLAKRQLPSAPPPPERSSVYPASFTCPAPPAETDIINWPPALLDPRLAQQRAIVEAPYRCKPAGHVRLTAADRQAIIGAVARMKLILGQMTGEISTADSLDAQKFLDQLAAEAKKKH
jgi:hypothetical protein